ncbi:MAG: 4Fe-4S dicluster domain-containing protein [Chloroflexota bacterium]
MTTAERHSKLFLDEVIDATPGGDSLRTCLQCGTCGGSCPSGADMEYTPRKLFAMIAAGMRDDVLQSNSFWYCVSCYYCMVRCPQEIHITDVMYSLKRMAIREGYTDHDDAPDFSQTFVGYIEHYGRSFEFGLATRYHLTHSPLRKVGMGSLALDMIARDRLALTPKHIKDLAGLQAILAKAKAIAGEAELRGGTKLL